MSRKPVSRRKLSHFRSAETLEVRALLTAEPFQQEVLYATTVIPEADDRHTMQVGDWNDDGTSDIFIVQRSGTASGQVEVSVYSSEFAYFDARNGGQTTAYIALLQTGLAATNSDWEFRIDNWGGGTKPDLFAIHKANTASGFVEVTIFSGESNFTTSSGLFPTALPTAGRDWVFDIGHYNNDGMLDLFAVRRNGEVSSELFVVSGAGPTSAAAFSTSLLQTNTAMPRTNSDYDFVVGDMGNDGFVDLLTVRKLGSPFGRMEISVLPSTASTSGLGPFRWFSTRTTNFIPDQGYDWSFDAAYFKSPHARPDGSGLDLVSLQKVTGSAPDMHFLSSVEVNPAVVFGTAAVPSSALSTSVAQTTPGLVGSYVNSSLRSVSAQTDWRTSQAIVGSRVDSSINFTTNSLGARSAVSVTGGSDANWDFFSVQWDGYISIPADGVRLSTRSNDGSRMWIDLNGDSQFDSIGTEFINNGWGNGQDTTVGPASIQMPKGVYKIRMQFEDGTGPNTVQLLWDFAPTAIPVSAYFADAGKTIPGITGSYVNASLRDTTAPPDWRTSNAVQISGTRVDAAIDFSRRSFGTRSMLGLTSGTDNDWDNFSVQWDGYVVIPANGVHLYTRSDDGSRMWIDVNRDGTFADTPAERLINGFGSGQVSTLSAPSSSLAAGTYRIRVQYEEGTLANDVKLLWDYNAIQKPASVVTGSSASSEQRPTVFWTPAIGAASYDIWIDNLTTTTSAYLRASTTDTWFTPKSDLGIGQYAAWVRSSDLDGRKSAWSPRFTFKVDTPVTIQPLSLTQSVARPVVVWNSLPGAVRYDVWVDNLATGQSQYIRLTNVTGTQWTPAADLPMGRYRIWVRGIDAAGVAAKWSAGADFVIATAPTPTAPTLPTFERRPTLSWSALPGAATYRITVKNLNTGAIVHAVSNIVATMWSVPQDLATVPYQWWVSAVSADGYQSAIPQKISFYVGGRPTLLTPTAASTTGNLPVFTWTGVTGAAAYELWVNRVDVSAAGVINVTGLTNPQFTATTALAAGTYRVWIRAVSGTGEISIWSAAVDFFVAASP